MSSKIYTISEGKIKNIKKPSSQNQKRSITIEFWGVFLNSQTTYVIFNANKKRYFLIMYLRMNCINVRFFLFLGYMKMTLHLHYL